jgi:hypothetical protein
MKAENSIRDCGAGEHSSKGFNAKVVDYLTHVLCFTETMVTVYNFIFMTENIWVMNQSKVCYGNFTKFHVESFTDLGI